MNGREFRRFWLTALGISALITLILSAPFVAWALVDFPDSTWLFAFAFIPLVWFYGRYLAWRTTTWIFDAEGKALVIRKGIVNQVERRIPLNFPPQVTFSQGWAGRLLDFGDAEVSSFGALVTFHQVGAFRAFKDALTSPGKVLPEKGPSFLAIVTIGFLAGLLKAAQIVVSGLAWLVRVSAPLLTRLLGWLFEQIRSIISVVAVGLTRLVRASVALLAGFLGWLLGQVQCTISLAAKPIKSPPSIQRSNVSAFYVSYDGLLAFCADFILSNGRGVLPLDCTRPDAGRRYYPTGISPDIAQIYLLILCRARIVILGTNGRSEWALRQQISRIDDIGHRISREAFEGIANWYLWLNRIESMILIKKEPEHTLGWTQ